MPHPTSELPNRIDEDAAVIARKVRQIVGIAGEVIPAADLAKNTGSLNEKRLFTACCCDK
jgi:hypothetical protein